MRLALMGFGHVGKELARQLLAGSSKFSFSVVGIQTAKHGAWIKPAGIDLRQALAASGFDQAPGAAADFLDACRADVMVELTTLDPISGQPAISHIRAALNRGLHVVTANKGPVAVAYDELKQLAEERGRQLLFESAVMDGAPVFNLARHCLPGARTLGFTGVLNSTTTVIIEAMEQGLSFEQGVEKARRLGITEANASYDVDGWDAAVKTAALANVLLGLRLTPLDVSRRGIGRLTPQRMEKLNAAGKTVRLVSRIGRAGKARVRAEVLAKDDPLAGVHGTSSLLFLETDRMGTLGILEANPGVAQTAYGVMVDLMEIARTRGGRAES